MRAKSLVWLPFVLMLSAFGLILSCSKNQEKTGSQADPPQAQHPEQYRDWEVFRYHKIQIIHPKNHPLIASFPQAADWYDKHIPNICDYLGLPPYADTLRIYYYTGYGQGESFTGRGYPFATKEAIYFWLPSTYGPTLTEFLLQQWKSGTPKHKFLEDGLRTLFDYSGNNYFAIARYYQHVDSNLSLRQLVADTHISSDSERFQSTFAATFVNFFDFTYGTDKLRALYQSDDDFESALHEVTGISIDSTESLWREFIVETFPEQTYDPKEHQKEITIPIH